MITDKHAKHAKALAELLTSSGHQIPPGLLEMRPPPSSGYKRGRGGDRGGGYGAKRGRFDDFGNLIFE